MKTRTIITIFSVIMLAVSSCQDKFHMPFKETDEGNEKVSFYLDGAGMRCSHEHGYLGMHVDTKFSWSDAHAYVFKCYLVEEGSSYRWGEIILDIRTEYPEKITAGTTYEVTEYTKPLTEEDLEAYYSTPHVWLLLNGVPANEGWIKFRSYTKGVASGNFEFDYIDEDRVTHTVRYGNFDSSPASFADYDPSFLYSEYF